LRVQGRCATQRHKEKGGRHEGRGSPDHEAMLNSGGETSQILRKDGKLLRACRTGEDHFTVSLTVVLRATPSKLPITVSV
jgi:hypothetical protein